MIFVANEPERVKVFRSPFIWGMFGFDCSSFCSPAYANGGIGVHRTSSSGPPATSRAQVYSATQKRNQWRPQTGKSRRRWHNCFWNSHNWNNNIVLNFDVLSEVLSVANTTLDFIGGALAFIFSPITFYVTTFAIAAGDQNVPLYLFMPAILFPIEIGLLLFVARVTLRNRPTLRGMPLIDIIDDISFDFISEFLVAISVILVSLYLAIMFHLYQKYILLVLGTTIVLVVASGVRLLRLLLFFP
jgi:hypothetical protein